MNDTAIKNYCIWARNELLAGVEARMRLYGVAEGAEPAGAAAGGGRALSPEETGWRDALLRAAAEEGFSTCATAPPTRFNRIAAVRYMEVHDFLPSRVRMFTRPAADGSGSWAARPRTRRSTWRSRGGPGAHSRAQAGRRGRAALPLPVPGPVRRALRVPPRRVPARGRRMALLLPANLMDPDGVIGRMVGDIPEEDWRNVQVLGWMYQYYNSRSRTPSSPPRPRRPPTP
ncbi:MAG: hypothetical protein ACLTYW_06760 [Collinsella sp.]